MILPLAELAIAIAVFILEVTALFLTFILGTSFAAKRARGLTRIAFSIAALAGVYLLTGFLRGFVPVLAQPGLDAFFSWPALGAAALIAFVFAIVPAALRQHRSEVAELKGATQTLDHADLAKPPLFVIYLLAIAIVFGGLSIWSSTFKAPRLADRICLEIRARSGDGLKELTAKGIALVERLTKKELSDKFRCEEEEG